MTFLKHGDIGDLSTPRRWCICFKSCQDRPFWLYECYHILLWATHPTTSLGDLLNLWKCWRYMDSRNLKQYNTPSSCNFPLLPAISMLWFSFCSSILGSSDTWSSSPNWKVPGSFLSKTLWHASRLAASTCGVVRWHCTIPWKELQRRGLHDIGIVEAYQRIDIWFVRPLILYCSI